MEKLKQLTGKKKLLIYVAVGLLGLVVLASSYAGYLYTRTPEHIRRPAFQHYHFRTQLIVNGEPVNFGDDKFQQAYDKSSCSTELTGTPIDFHDNADQMTHVHWDGMTGGEFLKYFGWNFIGGDDSTMGHRYDQGNGMMRMVRPHRIQRFGNLLPPLPDNASFYIYTGDKDGYEKKEWNDFLRQDLEEFLGKQSSIGGVSAQADILSWLFPKASAHGGMIDEHDEGEEKSEAELTRINNLIGNLVIFVQETEPTDEQIRERFNNLAPLHDSTCGG